MMAYLTEMDKFVLSNGELQLTAGAVDLTEREAVVLGQLWKRAKVHPHNPYSSAQVVANWIWGPPDCWPHHWNAIISQTLSHIRHKTLGRTWEIDNKRDFGYRFVGQLEVIE